MLKSLETKIAGLVEGAFGALSPELRPVEIARKLARRWMSTGPSVSCTYVPNEYSVYVSPPDRERFADWEDALVKELQGYPLEHARLSGSRCCRDRR